MKSTKEIFNFCNEFTFYYHYNSERVIEITHVRDCTNNASSKCDHIEENLQIRVLNAIDDISLMVIEGNVKMLFNN